MRPALLSGEAIAVRNPDPIRIFAAMKARMGRGLLVLGAALAASWLLYVLVANVFLATPGLRRFVDKHGRGDVHLTYQRAYSLWPGDLKARGLTVVARDPAFYVQIKADRASTQIRFRDLFQSTVTFSNLWARGVEVRVRPRLGREDVKPEVTAAFPSFQPFEDRPPPDAPPRPAPPDWTLKFTGLDARGLRLLWMGPYRWVGEGGARGGFALRLGRALSIEPSTVTLKHGALRQGEIPVALDTDVRITAGFEPVKLPLRQLTELLDNLRVDLDASAQVESLAFVQRHLGAGWKVSGGAGPLKVKGHFEKGRVLPDSALQWEVRDFDVNREGQKLSASAWLDLAMTTERVLLKARTEKARITLSGSKTPAFSPGTFATTLEAPVKDGKADFSQLVGHARIREGKAHLAGLNALFPKQNLLSFDDGEGDFAAFVWLRRNDRGLARLYLNIPDAAFTYLGTSVRGSLQARIRVGNLDANDPRLRLDGSELQLDNLQVKGGGAPEKGWGARVTASYAQAVLAPTPALDAEVSTEMSNAKPFLALFGDQAGLPKPLYPLFIMNGFNAEGRVRLREGFAQVEGLEAQGHGLRIRGGFQLEPKARQGKLLVSSPIFKIGVDLAPPEPKLRWINAEAWFRKP